MRIYLTCKFVIGHLPNLMALDLTKCLKRPKNSGTVTVTGKRVNRGAVYGSELPCKYLFCGYKFSCEWLKKKIAEEGFNCEKLCCTLCKTFR